MEGGSLFLLTSVVPDSADGWNCVNSRLIVDLPWAPKQLKVEANGLIMLAE